MNQRIQKLAEQAREYATTRHQVSNIVLSINNDKFEQKFAELIVRECMNIADGQKKYVEEMEVYNLQDEVWNRARIQQSEQIVDKIKQHFGVK